MRGRRRKGWGWLVLQLGEDPCLLLDDLAEGVRRLLGGVTEGFGDLARLLGVAPCLLGREPGAFLHPPQDLARESGAFCVLPHLLPRLPEFFREPPLCFGLFPHLFRGFPVPLRPLTTHFGLLTLRFLVPAAWLIRAHGALLSPRCTPLAADGEQVPQSDRSERHG